MFQRYSAIILGFMAGVLWPVWAQQASVRPLALFAVSLPVLSFLAGLLPAVYTIAVELLLFIALFGGYLYLLQHIWRIISRLRHKRPQRHVPTAVKR